MGIVDGNRAQPSPSVAISRGKGGHELSIIQAQIDRKVSEAHAMECSKDLKLDVVNAMKCDHMPGTNSKVENNSSANFK